MRSTLEQDKNTWRDNIYLKIVAYLTYVVEASEGLMLQAYDL